jgi:hypothetical protein
MRCWQVTITPTIECSILRGNAFRAPFEREDNLICRAGIGTSELKARYQTLGRSHLPLPLQLSTENSARAYSWSAGETMPAACHAAIG